MRPKPPFVFQNAAVGYEGLEARFKGFDLRDRESALLDLQAELHRQGGDYRGMFCSWRSSPI